MKRRTLLYWMLLLSLVAVTVQAGGPASSITPDAAISMLQDGNVRYVAGKSVHPRQDQARRNETAAAQKPFAAVLSCSDSRDPVEVLFDQGIGDIFVIRVAGAVADTDEIATLEYGAEHLGTPLILVLGHTKCGAVKAVVDGEKVGGSLPQLVDNIIPAVRRARESGATGDPLLRAAVEENVRQSMNDILARSEIIRDLVNEGKVKMVGGVYNIQSGAVTFLDSLPQTQAR